MSSKHRLIYFCQFFLFTSGILFLSTAESKVGVTLALFSLVFVSELFLVHQQTKIKAEAVYYKKGCLFALLDLLGAGIYLFYFGFLLFILIFKYSFEYSHIPLIILLSYTLLRKIYIFKNYSYEK